MPSSHNIGGPRKRRIMASLALRDGGWICWYCGVPLVKAVDNEQPDRSEKMLATIEHIKARADGGSNEQKNLVLSCRPCQRERHE